MNFRLFVEKQVKILTFVHLSYFDFLFYIYLYILYSNSALYFNECLVLRVIVEDYPGGQ